MPYPEDNTPLLAPRLAQFVFAFALTVLCSSWPARKIFGMFIEPTWFDKFVSHARYCEEGLSTQDYLAKSQARASLQKKRLARLREEATKGCVPKSKEHHQSHPLRSLPTVAAPSRLSRRRGPRSSHWLLARPCVACVIPPPPRLPQGRPSLFPPSEELPQPLNVFLSLHYARRSLIIEPDPPLHRARRRLGHDLQVPRDPSAKVPPALLREIIYQRRQHHPDGWGYPRTTGEREREGDALVLLRVVVGRIIGRNCLLLSCNPIISPSATPLGMTGRGKPTHIGLPSTPAQKPRADSESENVWRQVHASPTAKRR